MNLEQQVVSLELSRRLKELNVKQESLFYHYNKPYNDGIDDWVITNWEDYETAYDDKSEPYSAFTASELFEMLPAYIDIKKEEPFNFYWLSLQKRTASNIQYMINYRCDTFGADEFIQRILLTNNIYDESLCNCLAKILIHLIENNILPEDKNCIIPSNAASLIFGERK